MKHRAPRRQMPFVVKLLILTLLLLAATAAAEYAGLFGGPEFVEANVIDIQGTTLIIGRDCTAIVADTTPDQARSIRLGKEKTVELRPTTHDLYAETLSSFNITVEEAAMTRFGNDIYYAELVLRSGDTVLRLDSRPSDALAIALRADVPFMISKAVLEEKGQNIC
ncbi:MAG: bifunctional nuclease family protein [Candidatus Aenigmatarchaeota archaeon]|nr:MAG: bifunctional nuclease family protein [Candidatus Aenigmarchaeota archaeon]